MGRRIAIGTRGSELALTQAKWVAARLEAAHDDLSVHLEIIETRGDKVLDVPLAQIGGKGVFTQELEAALLDGRVDLAVHSLKDLPTELPDGLAQGPVPQRETARDAFAAAGAGSLAALPSGSRIGTSSLRRAAQLRAWRGDIDVVDLRGNVGTRLRKVDEGQVDAAILAAAGLERLGLDHRITELVPLDLMLPAPAQGALGLEIREGDADITTLLEPLRDAHAEAATRAERAFLAALDGGCQVPLGAYAIIEGESLRLDGCVCSLDGQTCLRTRAEGPVANAADIGRRAADALVSRGAADLIAAIR